MIKRIDKNLIDGNSFNWLFNRKPIQNIYPPIVWKHEDKYYQLNYFDVKTDEVMIFKGDFKSALQVSLDFYQAETINIIELSNILNLCADFNIDYNDINIFKNHGIKGKKNIEILKKIKDLPGELKTYIAEKNISLKIIAIYLKLNENLKNIISEYVINEKPSVGDFRKMVNLLFDNGRNIEINTYDKEYFKKFHHRNDDLKINFEKDFRELTKELKNINISNPDFFETDTLNICFSVNSYGEFSDKLKYLEENSSQIEKIYKLLAKYDLH